MRAIQLLDKLHDRDSFDCGNEALNQFFKQTARQHIQKGLSRTFVLVDTEQAENVLAFFTLSLCEVRTEKLPPKFAKKYPSLISGVKLARLAVAKSMQRQGIGAILMLEAMQRAVVVANNAGIVGLFVDAKDDAARAYYDRYGFISLKDTLLEMFLPLQTIAQMIEPS